MNETYDNHCCIMSLSNGVKNQIRNNTYYDFRKTQLWNRTPLLIFVGQNNQFRFKRPVKNSSDVICSQNILNLFSTVFSDCLNDCAFGIGRVNVKQCYVFYLFIGPACVHFNAYVFEWKYYVIILSSYNRVLPSWLF